MTEIYLIRHGEAEGNLYRRMQGQYDSCLTELGFQQIETLAPRFRDIPLDAVYSSDLYRAMETAAVLCRQKNLPLYTDKRLREVHVGLWEEMSFGDAAKQYPKEMALFQGSPSEWRLPQAETYQTVADRGEQAVLDIVKKHPNGRVAIVAHGFFIGALLGRLLRRPSSTVRGTNTAVSLLTFENGNFSLVYQHNFDHLPEKLIRIPAGRDLWFRPMTGGSIEEYIRYRQDGWLVVYGNLKGFNGPGFWLDAQRTKGDDPEAMVVGYLGKDPVGMIQLSPQRDSQKGVGYIPFIYLRQPYRHQGLGIQFIGHAVCFYRKLGRTKLQLSVAPTNEKALGFYHKFGFRQVKKQRGMHGSLLLMEKDIAPPGKPEGIRMIEV